MQYNMYQNLIHNFKIEVKYGFKPGFRILITFQAFLEKFPRILEGLPFQVALDLIGYPCEIYVQNSYGAETV